MRKIYVYCDEGVELLKLLTAEVSRFIRRRCDSIANLESIRMDGLEVEIVSANDVASNALNSADIFILPGGRDLPYLERLHGQGNDNLIQFVRRGGSYLGICAGAYFSSAFCDFERGTNLEVRGSRPLQFFKGTAKGCVYPGFCYGSTKGARIVRVIPCNELARKLGNNDAVKVYYNGGCELIPDGSTTENAIDKDSYSFEPLAYYEDCVPRKIALCRTKVGQGMVILSGVHPEYNAGLWELDPNLNYDNTTLDQDMEKQYNLFSTLLEMLIDPPPM